MEGLVMRKVELTEVRQQVSLEETRGKPQNPYSTRQSGAVRNVMNLKSTGRGPSKMNTDESLPKLLKVEEQVLKGLDQLGTVHLDLLASHIKAPFSEAVNAVHALTKQGLVVSTQRHGGGVTLMAEGRRIAALLAEHKHEDPHEQAPPTH